MPLDAINATFSYRIRHSLMKIVVPVIALLLAGNIARAEIGTISPADARLRDDCGPAP